MCASLISCPLCSQPHFNSLEALRIGLIKVATENLTCPICSDVFIGLDKLTIHLFSHRETKPNQDEDATKTKCVKLQKVINKPIDKETNGPHKKNTKYQKTNSIGNPSTQTESYSVPIFNINTLPFIGIPKNISENACNGTNASENTINESNQIKVLSEKCDICGFYFLGKNILQMHKKLIHNSSDTHNPGNKYPCHLCSKVFKMRGSLMVHLRVVHLGISPSTQLPSADDTVYIKEANTSLQRNDTKIIEENSNNYNPTKKTECKPFHNDAGETSTNNNVGVKQWECDICHKLFTTKYFLKKHKRLHTGEMPYSCVQCNKTFTFQQSYHKHLLYHNDDKPHTCSHCGRSFKELSTLHNHQRIHTGEKPFSCESCGKCFRQRVSYLVHRRIHTGVMPYKCTACDKSFRYKVSQRTHKCSVQPPGTVVRQSGELVQKLIKNHTDPVDNFNNNDFIIDKSVKSEYKQFVPDSSSINEAILDNTIFNKKCDDDGKSIIDEIINDSIKKIDFGEPTENMLISATNPGDVYTIHRIPDQNIPSPSEKFKGLTLTSSPIENSARNYEILPTAVDNNFRDDFTFANASYGEHIFGKMYK